MSVVKSRTHSHSFFLFVRKNNNNSNDVDMIVWSLFENGYKQCGDTPIGTYVTSVPNFLNGIMNQKAQDAEDQGQDDFDYPDAAQYIACTAYAINNNNYYLQFGCSDETSQAVTINIFYDNACTKPASVDRSGIDAVDVSSIQVSTSIVLVVFIDFGFITNDKCILSITTTARI